MRSSFKVNRLPFRTERAGDTHETEELTMEKTTYGYVRNLGETSYEEAISRVTEALKSEGFGILTEIDVRETFAKKLEIEYRPYVILGACNPHLAHTAIGIDPQIGLLLPCNVVIQKTDEGCIVSIADPKALSQLAEKPELEPVVEDADGRIRRVMSALEEDE